MARKKRARSASEKIIYLTFALDPLKESDRVAIEKYQAWANFLQQEKPHVNWTTNAILRELFFNLNDSLLNAEITFAHDLDLHDRLNEMKTVFVEEIRTLRRQIIDIEKKLPNLQYHNSYGSYQHQQVYEPKHEVGYIAKDVVESSYEDDEDE